MTIVIERKPSTDKSRLFISNYFDEFTKRGLLGRITRFMNDICVGRSKRHGYYTNSSLNRYHWIKQYKFTQIDIEHIYLIAVNNSTEINKYKRIVHNEKMNKIHDNIYDEYMDMKTRIVFDYLLYWMNENYTCYRNNMHGFLNGMIGRMYKKRNMLVNKLPLPDDVISIIEEFLGTQYG